MNPLRHSENSPFSLLNPPEGSAAATEGSLDTLVSQEEVHLGWGALWRGLICTHAHTHAHAHTRPTSLTLTPGLTVRTDGQILSSLWRQWVPRDPTAGRQRAGPTDSGHLPREPREVPSCQGWGPGSPMALVEPLQQVCWGGNHTPTTRGRPAGSAAGSGPWRGLCNREALTSSLMSTDSRVPSPPQLRAMHEPGLDGKGSRRQRLLAQGAPGGVESLGAVRSPNPSCR